MPTRVDDIRPEKLPIRINLYVVEDLGAGHEVALTVSRYDELARER